MPKTTHRSHSTPAKPGHSTTRLRNSASAPSVVGQLPDDILSALGSLGTVVSQSMSELAPRPSSETIEQVSADVLKAGLRKFNADLDKAVSLADIAKVFKAHEKTIVDHSETETLLPLIKKWIILHYNENNAGAKAIVKDGERLSLLHQCFVITFANGKNRDDSLLLAEKIRHLEFRKDSKDFPTPLSILIELTKRLHEGKGDRAAYQSDLGAIIQYLIVFYTNAKTKQLEDNYNEIDETLSITLDLLATKNKILAEQQTKLADTNIHLVNLRKVEEARGADKVSWETKQQNLTHRLSEVQAKVESANKLKQQAADNLLEMKSEHKKLADEKTKFDQQLSEFDGFLQESEHAVTFLIRGIERELNTLAQHSNIDQHKQHGQLLSISTRLDALKLHQQTSQSNAIETLKKRTSDMLAHAELLTTNLDAIQSQSATSVVSTLAQAQKTVDDIASAKQLIDELNEQIKKQTDEALVQVRAAQHSNETAQQEVSESEAYFVHASTLHTELPSLQQSLLSEKVATPTTLSASRREAQQQMDTSSSPGSSSGVYTSSTHIPQVIIELQEAIGNAKSLDELTALLEKENNDQLIILSDPSWLLFKLIEQIALVHYNNDRSITDLTRIELYKKFFDVDENGDVIKSLSLKEPDIQINEQLRKAYVQRFKMRSCIELIVALNHEIVAEEKGKASVLASHISDHVINRLLAQMSSIAQLNVYAAAEIEKAKKKNEESKTSYAETNQQIIAAQKAIDANTASIAKINNAIKAMETSVGELRTSIATTSEELKTQANAIVTLGREIEQSRAKLADQLQVNSDLREEVRRLEARVNTNRALIAQLDEQITSDLTALETEIKVLTSTDQSIQQQTILSMLSQKREALRGIANLMKDKAVQKQLSPATQKATNDKLAELNATLAQLEQLYAKVEEHGAQALDDMRQEYWTNEDARNMLHPIPKILDNEIRHEQGHADQLSSHNSDAAKSLAQSRQGADRFESASQAISNIANDITNQLNNMLANKNDVIFRNLSDTQRYDVFQAVFNAVIKHVETTDKGFIGGGNKLDALKKLRVKLTGIDKALDYKTFSEHLLELTRISKMHRHIIGNMLGLSSSHTKTYRLMCDELASAMQSVAEKTAAASATPDPATVTTSSTYSA